MLLELFDGLFADFRAVHRVLNQVINPISHRHWIAGDVAEPSHSVLHVIVESSAEGIHHRHSDQHALECGSAETVDQCRNDHSVRFDHDPENIVGELSNVDTIPESKALHKTAELSRIADLFVTHDHQLHVATPPPKLGDGQDPDLEALVPIEGGKLANLEVNLAGKQTLRLVRRQGRWNVDCRI